MTQQPIKSEGLRATQKRQRQAAIIAAGRQIFLLKGRDASTIEEIAAAAGVSALTVFNYFGDKDALFLAVWTELRQEAHTELREAISRLADATPRRLIEAYLIQLMRVSVGEERRDIERRLWCDFYAAHFTNNGKGLRNFVSLEDDMILADLQHILQWCIERGACRPSASLLDIAEGILAIGNLHWLRWLNSEDASDKRGAADMRVQHTLRQVWLFIEPLLGLSEQKKGNFEE